MPAQDNPTSASGVSPSSLPYYENNSKSSYTMIKQEPSSIEVLIRTTRESVYEVYESVAVVVDTGKAHLQGALSELREEENVTSRVAVIGGATLVGLTVGSLRGRRASRVFYSLVGVGSGVVVCYPRVGQEVKKLVKEVPKVFTGEKLESPSFSVPVVDPVVVMETMKTSLQSLFSKCQELYSMAAAAVQSAGDAEPPRSSLVAEKSRTDPETLSQVGNKSSTSKTESSLVFLPPSSLVASTPVEGDPGMGSEEDSDMYTTRG